MNDGRLRACGGGRGVTFPDMPTIAVSLSEFSSRYGPPISSTKAFGTACSRNCSLVLFEKSTSSRSRVTASTCSKHGCVAI
jgi:hypothetical protein